MAIERACINDISLEKTKHFGKKFTGNSNFQTREKKRDARRSRNIFESRSLESLKIERWIIKKDIEASHLERKKVTYLTTLDNSKLTTRNFFDRSSWFLANRGRFEDRAFLFVFHFSKVFSHYRKSQFFPTRFPAFEIATISVQRQEMIHFRPVEESERTMDQFVFRPPPLPSYLSLHRFSAASNVSTPSLLFYHRD